MPVTPPDPSAETLVADLVADLVAEVPELAEYVRAAVLLRPAAGSPGVRDSSVGGPLLWPAGEPWPLCPHPHMARVRKRLTDEEREALERMGRARRERRRSGRRPPMPPEEAETPDRILDGASSLDMTTWERVRWVADTGGPDVPMVPVAQLHARDVPGLPRPDGADVLQVLWCPNDHSGLPGQPHYSGPAVELRYRAAAAVDAVADPPRPHRALDLCLPSSCTVDPVRVADLPSTDDLPAALAERARAWAAARGVDHHRLACRSGWKVGGRPSRHLTGRVRVDRPSCGAGTRLLLTVGSSHGGPDVTVGRFGELRVFTCAADASHPVRLDIQ
ncbi:hypothetical protein GCM10010420_27270 [Streptomyces glaucosporus]|uniref:Uncharacterized protein n=1 Tax=Streptomyces glaucosporus TaxID=284044 RepID=A0ABP5VCD7_9ACTN